MKLLFRPAACLAVAVMLIIGIFPVSESYTFALVVVTALVALMEIFYLFQTKKGDKMRMVWITAFIGMTVILNPFLPLKNNEILWMAVKAFSAVIFAGAAAVHLSKLQFVRKPSS